MNLKESYRILNKVLREGTYMNLAFREFENGDKALQRKIVYGTLENYYLLNAVVDALSSKPPKPAVRVLLLESAYCLLYLDMPAYAVVNEAVNLCKQLKTGVHGYVNAVLKKIAAKEYTLPSTGKAALEIKYNLPYWMIERFQQEFPDCFDKILTAKSREEEHIRLHKNTDKKLFLSGFPDAVPTDTGFYHSVTPEISALFRRGKLTFQGYHSTLAVEAFGDLNGKTLLDTCSAPGGKSVFAAEKGAKVTACDVHPHRVELIKEYARRMKADLKAEVRDGTKFVSEWEGKFDCVLVDAPCSGLGVIGRRRDMIFKRTAGDIASLHALQVRLLKNAVRYVKKGGILVYSTCTLLKKENLDSANTVAEMKEFRYEKLPFPIENEGYHTFLPHVDGEGFFIARFRRGEK